MVQNTLSCWVVVEDGLTGTENQCIGVTEALNIQPLVQRIRLRQPWSALSPYLAFEGGESFSPPLPPAFPDLLITAGRKSIAAARYIKKKSGGRTFTVHLQDPRYPCPFIDLIAVPHHDRLRGKNVLVTDGAVNRITASRLESAREAFSTVFSALPSPRVAVLIGGDSKTHRFSEASADALAQKLAGLHAGLMVTVSRRTGDSTAALLRSRLLRENVYFWDGTGDNPYMGILAWADYIVVTSDSVSMLSDAGSTGKPVYIHYMEGGSDKFTRLYDHFTQLDIIRPFMGVLEPWSYPPLCDAQKVADAIRKEMNVRA